MKALGGRLHDVDAKGEATAMDFDINTRSSATGTVSRLVTLELIDTTGVATPLETEFSYNPRDPYAMTATFNTLAGQVRWTFGRDLLIALVSFFSCCCLLDRFVTGNVARNLSLALSLTTSALGGIRGGYLGASSSPPTVWALFDSGRSVQLCQSHCTTQWPCWGGGNAGTTGTC